MFLKKYVLFSFCLIVFFIYAFNVRLSNCHDANAGIRDKRNIPGQAPGAPGAQPSSILELMDKVMAVEPMPFITVPSPLVFEGVDYDYLQNLSAKIYHNYYDCYYWHTICIRDTTYFHTICAYESSELFINFSNKCQLELWNCRHRMRNETWKPYEGIYGNIERDPWDLSEEYKYIKFYHGDGYNCKYYWFRRQLVTLYNEDEQEDFDKVL